MCFKQTCFQLEHAQTTQEKQRGLMYRVHLPTHNGMLFSWQDEHHIAMWMKNTYIPLDILWLNRHHRVVYIKKNATPNVTIPIRPPQKAQFIIELNGGAADTYCITIGDKATFTTNRQQ